MWAVREKEQSRRIQGFNDLELKGLEIQNMKKLLVEIWKTMRGAGLEVSLEVKFEKSVRHLSGDVE